MVQKSSSAKAGIKKNPKRKSGRFGKGFPIVAIGASAGGMEAVTELLKNLSPDTGMAYVYIQHLDPVHESILSDILAKATPMRVQEATERMPILPNHVYVIPPNKDMVILDGALKLTPRPRKPEIHLPINSFFFSLAENLHERAIAVVLSGNASDGADGLRAIKTAGGFTFAQDESAKFQSMPKSAMAEGAVDLVLSPKEIAKELERLSEQDGAMNAMMNGREEDSMEEIEELKNILQLLKMTIGVDFSHYKTNTIKRRMVRRMLLSNQQTLRAYWDYLKQHPNEINALHQDLLINVTGFFRDPASVDFMKKVLLPRIIKTKSANDPLRIWVPACSSGEETYSIAMILTEVLGELSSNIPVQIFATDLSEGAIARARLGVYSKADLAAVSPKRIQRFFTKPDGSYRIVKPIRDLCIFAPHNVLKDPPFSRLDIISCCNLMIYLDTVLQKKLLATFHYGLNPGGYLVLGKSETIGTAKNLFTQLNKKLKIYQSKKDAGARAGFEVSQRITDPGKYHQVKAPAYSRVRKDAGDNSGLEKMVDNILLTRYVPSSVVVNQDFEILQFRGSTGMFLEPAPGKASLNLLKMARPGLGFELRNAVHKVAASGEPFKKYGLEMKYRGNAYHVRIEVIPLRSENEEKYFLVIFEETLVPIVPPASAPSNEKRVKRLELELMTTREDMRTLIEEQEVVNEELQSANEEIVSSNEELQSINEELETSKEELESTNEELGTINQEMQVRNDQLAESNEYAEAIIATIREAVLVLDTDLRVKTANKSFYKTFNVREEETEGRLVFELGDRQWDIPRLRELLEKIIPENAYFFGFEVQHVFQDIGEKIMMLNARRIVQKTHRQQLILLAIEDVTERVVAQRIIGEREMVFRNLADNAPVMIWTAGVDRLPVFFNKTWLEFTGRKMEEELGTGWSQDIHQDDRDRFLRTYYDAFETQKTFRLEYRMRRRDGEYRWVMVSAKPEFRGEKFSGYIGTVTDMHDQRVMSSELEKRVQQRTRALQEANRNLEASNSELEQFAYVASHDLQEPLRKIITYSDMLSSSENRLSEQAIGYMHKISVSSQRMQQLIEDLLNISRVDISREKFVKADLKAIFNDAMVDFDVAISKKGARVIVEDLPVIEGVPSQMKQLFYNLISNALKFTRPDTKPVLYISSHLLSQKEVEKNQRLDKTRKYYEIIFKDNGIGFKPEFAEQIFVIFQRLHAKDKFPGTGIGLALCRKIVTNHGGDIFARSGEMQGAAFHIILPVKADRS